MTPCQPLRWLGRAPRFPPEVPLSPEGGVFCCWSSTKISSAWLVTWLWISFFFLVYIFALLSKAWWVGTACYMCSGCHVRARSWRKRRQIVRESLCLRMKESR